MKETLLIIADQLNKSGQAVLMAITGGKCCVSTDVEDAFTVGVDRFWGVVVTLETIEKMSFSQREKLGILFQGIRGIIIPKKEMANIDELSLWTYRTLQDLEKKS